MTNIISAIIGALFAGWIAWFITKRNTDRTILASLALNRIQERRKAAATFRNEFLGLLLVLKDTIELPNEDIPKAFVSYVHCLYPKHAAAVIAFAPYLGRDGIERINKAWFDYCFPNGIKKGTKDEEKYAHPLDDYGTMPENKARKVALEKIEKLLSISGHIISFS
uniref:Uncharacterized protein n=1 Tax=viral metagenome TaxID=1070528 RepID=A0A6M3IJ27_9ZZZZ